jgi:putative SOS response-associated peptidase YedK
MPVILLAEDHERWLTGSLDDATGLQAGYPTQLMAMS